MVLHCNQSSDVLVIPRTSFLPLQSDFSPREVWNLSENVKSHIKVSKSNFLTVVKVQQVGGGDFCHPLESMLTHQTVCFSLSLISIPHVFLAVFCNVWLQFLVPFITKISLCWCFVHIAEHIGLLFFLSTQLHLSLLDRYLYVTLFNFSFYILLAPEFYI